MANQIENQKDLYEQYLSLKKNQLPTLPQQEKSLYQKYLEFNEKIPISQRPKEIRPLTQEEGASFGQQVLAGLKLTGEVPLGLAEAGAQVGTGMAFGFPAAMARSIIAPILNEDYEKAEKKGAELAYKLTYAPQTEAGKVYGELFNKPFQFAGDLLRKASEKFAPDDPKSQSIFRTLSLLGVIAAAPFATKSIKSFVRKKVTKGEPISIKDIKPQVEPLVPPEQITPVQKIINALKEAKPLRKKQEALYTKERGKRFALAQKMGKKVKGEKGFYAEKAKLKGELPKVEFEPIRNKLTQPDVDVMFKQIADSPALNYLETFPAREGLAKLFGKYGGRVPTGNELFLLDKVFGRELIQTVLTKRNRWAKIKSGMLEAANVPRALMTSYDLSFGLRQGVFLATRYPKQFASAFAKQFKLFGSEKAFKLLKEEIASRPTYELMRRGKRKLALTEIDSPLSLREEAFMGAAWAEKIPIAGLGVRPSARAYTGFANKLRADVFDYLIKTAEKTGRNPWKDSHLVDSIIDFVNAGSGRGSLKMLEKSAVTLNTVLFSPRLVSSRLNLLNPRFYYKLDPFVRKQALQSLFAFAGATTTVLGLAKLGGLEVGANPFSADFLKIKIGNTRIDIMGGFQQYIRTAAQFLSGQTVSTTTGKVSKVGEGYKPITRLGILTRGLEYKLAPVASFAVNLLRGRTALGEPTTLPKEVGNRFVPMVMQDVIDLSREDPELLPVATLGIFGVGLQTYGPRKKEGAVY